MTIHIEDIMHRFAIAGDTTDNIIPEGITEGIEMQDATFIAQAVEFIIRTEELL